MTGVGLDCDRSSAAPTHGSHGPVDAVMRALRHQDDQRLWEGVDAIVPRVHPQIEGELPLGSHERHQIAQSSSVAKDASASDRQPK